jgi:DNA-binding SARP family transcriptional activator
LAERAVALDPSDARGYAELGWVKLYAKDVAGALDSYLAAHRLNPNDPDILALMADALVYAGRPAEALELVARAKRLNPHYPDIYLWSEADALFALRRYDEVIATIGRMRDPSEGCRLLAASHALAGRPAEAHRYAELVLRRQPGFSVADWIASLPPEAVSQDPWLVYWSGLCRVPGDLPRARADLLQAFQAFRTHRDPAGLYLAWAGIVDTFYFGVHEWRPLDRWIATFENLRKTYPAFPSREIELIASSRFLMAIALRRMNRPALVRRWLDRVDALLRETFSPAIQMDVLFAMTVYYLWKGDYEKNAHLVEKAESGVRRCLASPFACIRVKLMKGIHLWVTARYGEAMATLSEGLEVSVQSGVHLFDSLLWSFQVAARLAQGDLAGAADSLKKQREAQVSPANALDDFFLQVNSAWLALLSGNAALAVHHLEIVAGMVRKLGNPYYQALWNIGLAQAAYRQHDRERAWACLKTARRHALGIRSEVMDWYTSLISAYFHLQEGQEKDGLACLRHGLALSAKQGFVHLEFYQPAVMRFLLGKALEEGLARQHVHRLIRTLSLPPPPLEGDAVDEPTGVEHWPYPVKVKTMGEFAVFRDDQLLNFAGKPPKKPLDILKTLIALGGRNVPVTRLTDTLWPDADGDAAGNSFKVNLHHLRQLLGDPEAIVGKGACLSVNSQRCLVDALAFQHLADRALQPEEQDAGPAEQRKRLAIGERALALYRGSFLQDEDGALFVAAREKLRHRFLRLVEMVMNGYEARQEWTKAIGLGERSIELDDLEERFYTRLMLCYRKMGRHDAAVSIYDRFCRVLEAKKGGQPSPGMTALYRTLLPANEAAPRA